MRNTTIFWLGDLQIAEPELPIQNTSKPRAARPCVVRSLTGPILELTCYLIWYNIVDKTRFSVIFTLIARLHR